MDVYEKDKKNLNQDENVREYDCMGLKINMVSNYTDFSK